jgi:putative DNA primase/helicase
MRTTENALEALAQRSSGTVLALDELTHAGGHAIGRMIYSIAGGTGRTRVTATAGLREPTLWATVALLSGEPPLEQKVRSDWGRWTSGMAVRIPDIDFIGGCVARWMVTLLRERGCDIPFVRLNLAIRI